MATAIDRSPVRRYGGVAARERVAARRERLLAAAIELYGTEGYAGTGVKDICRQAGLTDRYFYESFADGRELFLAAFERATSELLALVAKRVGEAAPEAGIQARAAIEAFVGALAEDARKARLLFVEAAAAGAEIESHVRTTVRRFADLVAQTARPHLPPAVPEQHLQMGALSLVGAIALVIVEWQAGEVDVTVEELVDYFVGMFAAAGTYASAS